MIRETPITCSVQRLYCDDCGEEMKPTGKALLKYPMQYPHKCQECGKEIVVANIYPLQTYKEAT